MDRGNLHILVRICYNRSMRRFVAPALAVMAVLVVSCGTVNNTAKRFPNMVADAEPVPAGTIEAEFDRLLSSRLNKYEVEAIFYPRLNAVALEFKHEFITYRQFWDQNGRVQFAEALERYKVDYDARNLVDRYGRTKAVYGKLKGRLEWETFKLAQTRVSFPVIEIGYRFKENAPFFATRTRSAKEEKTSASASGDGVNMENTLIHMYFTRAQADDLVKLFDQTYLMGLIAGPASTQSDRTPELDDYQEYGD